MLQGRADDVTPAVASLAADPDVTIPPIPPSPASPARGRHLRRVGAGGWGNTDLSHLSQPPTPVAQLPVAPPAPTPEVKPDPDADSWRVVNKRGAKHVAARLTRSETVKRMARGTVSRRKGVLVLTTQRLLFVRDRGSGASSIDFHLASVSSISIERSPSSSRIVIHCLGVLTEVYDVPHAEAQSLVDEAQQILSYIRFPVMALKPRRVSKRTPLRSAEPEVPSGPSSTGPTAEVRPVEVPTALAPAPAPADPSSLLVAHLRELAQLHQAGLLDDYEFAMAKAKLLT